MSDTITRVDLEKMNATQPENKEKTISRIVNDYKDRIIVVNAKGEKSTELLLYDNRPEIESKVIEKMKELFVDVDITITTVGLCKMLCINWELAPSESKAETKAETKVETKAETNVETKVETDEESDDESDDESDEESDDDPLELNLHIVVSNSRNMDRTMEMMTACMMVISFVMSGAASWALVAILCKKP